MCISSFGFYNYSFSIGGEGNCWATEKEAERDRDGAREAEKTAFRDGQKREGGEEEDGGGVWEKNAGGEGQGRGSREEAKGGVKERWEFFFKTLNSHLKLHVNNLFFHRCDAIRGQKFWTHSRTEFADRSKTKSW